MPNGLDRRIEDWFLGSPSWPFKISVAKEASDFMLDIDRGDSPGAGEVTEADVRKAMKDWVKGHRYAMVQVSDRAAVLDVVTGERFVPAAGKGWLVVRSNGTAVPVTASRKKGWLNAALEGTQ